MFLFPMSENKSGLASGSFIELLEIVAVAGNGGGCITSCTDLSLAKTGRPKDPNINIHSEAGMCMGGCLFLDALFAESMHWQYTEWQTCFKGWLAGNVGNIRFRINVTSAVTPKSGVLTHNSRTD